MTSARPPKKARDTRELRSEGWLPIKLLDSKRAQGSAFGRRDRSSPPPRRKSIGLIKSINRYALGFWHGLRLSRRLRRFSWREEFQLPRPRRLESPASESPRHLRKTRAGRSRAATRLRHVPSPGLLVPYALPRQDASPSSESSDSTAAKRFSNWPAAAGFVVERLKQRKILKFCEPNHSS